MTAPSIVLKAFICGQGCVKHVAQIGSSDLPHIINSCPSECRYAIVLWDDAYRIIDVKGEAENIKAMRSYPDIDTAIMAAQLTY